LIRERRNPQLKQKGLTTKDTEGHEGNSIEAYYLHVHV